LIRETSLELRAAARLSALITRRVAGGDLGAFLPVQLQRAAGRRIGVAGAVGARVQSAAAARRGLTAGAAAARAAGGADVGARVETAAAPRFSLVGKVIPSARGE